jgi:hypothetical protein
MWIHITRANAPMSQSAFPLNDSKISSVQNAVALKRSTRMQLSFCEDDLPALYGGILHV